MVHVQEVQITATRATDKTPIAHTNLDRKTIEKNNFGRDIPFLLEMTPGAIATSDAGAGVGYTYFRLRGTDASRINVTANGVPMNDGESHSLYWVNTPDLISSMNSIQIQRGVGTSTNGAGAFGGSINMTTAAASIEPFAEISGSYGSYCTHRESVAFGSGLMGGHWTVDGRLSNLGSDGYIQRASSDMYSYFGQIGYFNRNTAIKLLSFGGQQAVYHAWDGIEIDQLRADRRYNPCGEILNDKGELVGFYDDQKDHYKQFNNQLIITQRLNNRWNLNLTAHYTRGDGYYNQYKNDQDIDEYDLRNYLASQGIDPIPETSNLIREKHMVNDFGGAIATFKYRSDRLDFSLGGAWNLYDGYHYGRVSYLKALDNSDDYLNTIPNSDHIYYRNSTDKTDMNVFARAEWSVSPAVNLYADLQYRRIHHRIEGINDKYDAEAKAMQPIDVDRIYDFFNPKAGLYYTIDSRNGLYASVGVAHKEPTRNNFTDAKPGENPRAERLVDFEAGYSFAGERYDFGVNLYYMKYKDQLVLTGEINSLGEALATNVPDSYRRGIELMAGIRLTPNLRWDINATFSQNKILDYVDYVEDWTNGGQQAIYLGTTDISFSPNLIVNSSLSYSEGGFDASLRTNYVSKQYVSNASIEELSFPSYCLFNLTAGYTFHLRGIRSLFIGMEIRNLFNEIYYNNGWSYSGLEDGIRINGLGYYPQATRNYLFSINLKF